MLAESTPTTWALVTFVAYIVGVFGLAAAAHQLVKRRAFLSEYFLGSRGLGVWAFAMTYAATSASGGSFTGFPAKIYAHGWVLALWIGSYMLVPICCMGLLGKRLNQVARKCGAVTVPDVFRDRHGSAALGLMSTVFITFFLVAFLIAQFKAGAVIVQTLLESTVGSTPAYDRIVHVFAGTAASFDVPPAYLMGLVFFALIVVFYTAYGGFRAVVWTDVMQGLIMVIGVVLLLPLTLHTAYVYLSPVRVDADTIGKPIPQVERYAGREQREAEPFRLAQLPEGLRKVNDHLKRNDPAAMTGPGAKVVATESGTEIKAFLPLSMAISFFFMWAISGTGQPGTMIRLMAFRDSKILRRAIFTVCMYYGLIYLPLVVIFVTAKTLPLGIEPGQEDKVMPTTALFVAPPVLAGLLIAAPFAAVMSTVDSFLLMISSALVRDVYQRSINPNVSRRTIKWMSYTTTGVVGFVAAGLAINAPRFLQDLIIFGGTGLASTLLAAMALTLYWPRSNAAGMAAAMIGGCATVGVLYIVGSIQAGQFTEWAPLGLHPIIWGLSGSVLAGIVGSLLTAPPSAELVTKYFYKSS